MVEEVGDGGAGVVDVEVLVLHKPVRQVVAHLPKKRFLTKFMSSARKL